MTGTQDADGHTTADAYNVVGDLVKSIDARGYATTYTVDMLDRQVSQTDPDGNTTQQVLDGGGQRGPEHRRQRQVGLHGVRRGQPPGAEQ